MTMDQQATATLTAAPTGPPPRTPSAVPPLPWQPAIPYPSIGAAPGTDDAVSVLGVDLARRRITVGGELDCATTGQLDEAMTLLLNARPGDSTVDLLDLRFIDAGGIGTLVSFANSLAARGASLIIVGVGDNVRRLFDLLGLGAMLDAAA